MKHEKNVLLAFVALLILITCALWFWRGREPKMLDLPIGDRYDADWARVDSFANKGLPRSAFDQVRRIANKAISEHNEVQMLKVALKGMAYISQIEGDWELTSVRWLKAGTVYTKFPLRQVFHSVLGQFYSNYAVTHQWQLMQRTAVMAPLPEDHRTWDLQRLAAEADRQYQLSLRQPDDLRRVPIDYVDPVLLQWGGRSYRPTLWDLLAWRAIEFYANGRMAVTQPAFQYKMHDPAYFGTDKEFLSMDLSRLDSTSFQVRALRIFQGLTQQHLYDRNPEARLMANMERLKYVAHHAEIDAKDSLLLVALQALQDRYSGHEVSALVAAEVASIYIHQPYDPFGPDKDKNRDSRLHAMQILQAAIDDYGTSDGGNYCLRLRDDLLTKELGMRLDGPATFEWTVGLVINLFSLQDVRDKKSVRQGIQGSGCEDELRNRQDQRCRQQGEHRETIVHS